MFDPFKVWDEMLGIYNKMSGEPEMVVLQYEVPEELADELDEVIVRWLESKGVELDESEEVQDAG